MIKELLKKFKANEEPEELDTGYDSDYYGGAYSLSAISRLKSCTATTCLS